MEVLIERSPWLRFEEAAEKAGFQGGISIVVGPAACGQVGTGRYPVRSPLARSVFFPQKIMNI